MATLAFPGARRTADRTSPPAGLLSTKLHPPRARDALVARPRLDALLEQGLRRKLTLISAPAGSGKSTLLVQWLRHARLPVGWLALDEADNHPGRFMQYLLATLHQARPDLDGSVEPLLQAGGTIDLQQLLAALIVMPLGRDEQPLALVLDDYHVIHNEDIHRALVWLLEHLPPALHLILTTRHDPPLPLARLRVRDELTEIRSAGLRFSRTEAADFLRQVMQLELSDSDIDTLEARTEGWIAALQLSALSLRHCPDPRSLIASLGGDHHLIADYLVQEVLERQPPERRAFLLRTAVLERLCGPLCAALTGRDDAQAVLETLDTANLFLIPLDDRRRWYRYHHLFAELLRRRLNQELPGEGERLHRAASRWFHAQGLVHEAIEHARLSGDRSLLTELLEAEGESLIKRGDTDAVRGWLEVLPVEIYRRRPQLAVLEGWCTSVAGQYARAGEVTALGRQGLNGNNELDRAEKQRIEGHFTAIRSFVASCTGDNEGGLALAEQALAQLPAEDRLVRSTMALSIGNNHVLAGRCADAEGPLTLAVEAGRDSGNLYVASVALWCRTALDCLHGRLHRAQRHTEQNQAMLETGHCEQLPLIGFVEAGRGLLDYHRQQPEAAERWLRRSLDQADRLRDIGFQILTRTALTRALLARNQISAARAVVDEAAARAEAGVWHDHWGELAAVQARLALAEGDPDRCETLLHGRALDLGRPTAPTHALNLERVRLALSRQHLDELLAPLAELLEATEAEELLGNALELRVLHGIALERSGRADEALAGLQQAVRQARPEGFRRPFAEHAAALAALAVRLEDTADRAFLGAPEAPGDDRDRPGLIEPLSARERDVLALVARGLSNRAIAEQLHVSVGTVKTHLHNVLGKIQVGNRTEAAHRARELGLLSDG